MLAPAGLFTLGFMWGTPYRQYDSRYPYLPDLKRIALPPESTPVAIVSGQGSSLSCCALLTTGEVWCFGSNRFGELGNKRWLGTDFYLLDPVRVELPPGAVAVSVSMASMYGCAVLNTGKLMCWGTSFWETLNDLTLRLVPFEVPLPPGTQALYATSGSAHTCVILNGTGGLWCFGSNYWGSLGVGDQVSYRVTPVKAWLPENDAVVLATAGQSHTCASLLSGKTFCFGSNLYSALGAGVSDQFSTIPLQVSLAARPVSLFASGSVTCALLITGDIECWGLNDKLKFGDGTNISNVPVLLPALPDGVIPAYVGVGWYGICVFDDLGDLYCYQQVSTLTLSQPP